MNLTGVIDEVQIELERARKKFPAWPTDPLHALAVLGEEYGELTKAVLQHTYEPEKSSLENVRMEAIQTAAMALRLLMSLDVYEYRPCPQHAQPVAAVPSLPVDSEFVSSRITALCVNDALLGIWRLKTERRYRCNLTSFSLSAGSTIRVSQVNPEYRKVLIQFSGNQLDWCHVSILEDFEHESQ